MTTSRTWLVLFINSEVLRRYQWPVSVERVLAEHRAAVAAVPISEGMGTCAAPIEAPAGCAQAGEGHAALRVPRQEARSTGCLWRPCRSSRAWTHPRHRSRHLRAVRKPEKGMRHCGSP